MIPSQVRLKVKTMTPPGSPKLSPQKRLIEERTRGEGGRIGSKATGKK